MNHCQNGGTCLTGINETPFFCICPEGYVGIDCNETEKGESLTASRGLCEVQEPCSVASCPRRGPAPLALGSGPGVQPWYNHADERVERRSKQGCSDLHHLGEM